MNKWTLKRVFAMALAVMMILTVPEVSAATVLGVEADDAVVESTETNDVVEEDATEEEVLNVETIEGLNNTIANTNNIELNYVELGSTLTTAGGMSFFTTNPYVDLASGNFVDWIDRIDLPAYGDAFYATLAESVDNDGTRDYLIDDIYFSSAADTDTTDSYTYVSGYNVIEVGEVEYATVPTDDDVMQSLAVIRAAYDAFDRDYPEVFWLTGDTVSVYTEPYTTANGYAITYYFVIKAGTDFDIRATDYQSASAIEADITARDNAINTILSGTTATDTVELIKYFNNWLTKNNAYCTATTYPALSYECLSALLGSETTEGPVCEAYARAFKILCNKKNIPCVLVDGYATSDSNPGEAHMWNYVQVGTNWYAVDVTWNDPYLANGAAVSGYENEGWLLLGSDTVVTTSGMTFIESHPVSNQASQNGVCFTNGPVLSSKAYAVSDIKSASIDNWETIYGYGADTTPTVTITLEDDATGVITYQWFEATFDTAGNFVEWSAISEATTNKLPTGLDSNIYYVQVYYNGEKVLYSDVYVYMKELTPNIEGSTSKTYDGTTDCTGTGLSISLEGIVNGDDISVSDVDFAYTDANAGTNKTINATNIVLAGDKYYNYYIDDEAVVSDNVGTIAPKNLSDVTITLDKTSLYYNGTEQKVNVTITDGTKTLVEGTDYTVSGNTAKDVQDSAYTVTIVGKGNYTGSATETYTLSYLNDTVTVKYDNSTTVKDWYTNAVTITADGYTISDELDGTYSANYLVETEGTTSGLKLYFKNADGYITDAKDIATIKIDKTAPADLTITVKENPFKKLLDTITFGIFNISTQDVTISATETNSGIDNYYIYVDNSGSTTVKTATQLAGVEFKEFSTLSLDADGKYVIYAYAVDNAGNRSGYICTDGIVIDTIVPTITDVKTPTIDNGNLKDTSVTISFKADEIGEFYYVSDTNDLSDITTESLVQAGADTKTSMVEGTNTFTVNGLNPNTKYFVAIVAKDLAGNYSTVATVTFTTQKILPTITVNPTIKGTYGQAVKDMTLTNGTASVTGTWAISPEATDVPEVGTTNKYVVIFTPADTNTYGSVTVEVTPTVEKKAVTVTINDATKTFGTDNPTFTYTVPDDALVGDDTNTDLGLVISTTATKTSDVGTYEITGTANAKNYSVTFTNGTLTITKATATNPAAIEKEYVYGLGSEGNVYITLGNLLPADNGGAIYDATKVDENNIIDNLACGENELLYSVKNTGEQGNTATITVIAKTKNYEDITITVNIKLVDKLTVSLKEGTTVTTVGSLTYGDALSELTFGDVTFVDTEGNEVEGTITWNDPTTELSAGTHDVAWTFTPSNTGKYKVTTGTVSVTVAKATPNVATPTAEGITYDPNVTLGNVNIISGTTEVEGTWTWKETSTVPTVGNEGYVAVFTPADIHNYNTVEKTVAVEVAKATPNVTMIPQGTTITYGQTLADSEIEGGEVNVPGTWAWKDATIAPVVADSGVDKFDAIFTPEDTTNYNTVTVTIALTVERAQWPANTPADEIAADYDWNTVGKVELPEGWVWADDDAETVLEFEEEVTATANYVGDDKDNFVNLSKEIKITRNVDAPHIEGDETTMGWNAIADEMKDTDEEVRVDMNGHTAILGDALETLRDEDATIVLIFEDGTTWTIKGEDVEDGEVKSRDMKVELFAKDATDKPAIPENLVNEVIANAKDHKFLSLSHDGEFGFKATLTINVGTANAGKLATLYYYNEETGKLEKTENVKIEVDANGNISLVFAHASDYVLSIEDKPVEQKPEDNTPTPKPGTPGTGDSVFGNVYFYITLLLAGGLAGYVGVRKKREE